MPLHEVNTVNPGDTAWLLASSALVMFMTPGLAFFLRRARAGENVVGTMMQSFIALALVTVLWVLVGYSLAFGPDKAGLIGGLDFVVSVTSALSRARTRSLVSRERGLRTNASSTSGIAARRRELSFARRLYRATG